MSAEPRPIDPLAPGRPAYVDDLVRVVRTDGELPRRTLRTVRTEHFDISHQGHVVRVAHRVPLDLVHTGLSELLSREIFGPGWLRGADVFCAPSLRGESFGMILLEAMAVGVPCVATNVTGIPANSVTEALDLTNIGWK